MPDIRINTDEVRALADTLKRKNDNIRKGLSNVKKAINNLDKVWDGPAAGSVIARFSEIETQYENERYKTVDNYVRVLKNLIGEGYDQTEDVNTKLAEQFK